MKYRNLILTVGLWVLVGCSPGEQMQPEDLALTTRPNILLIVVDDLGYTDLGAFGGEIPTPNLDALARRGVRLSNFHTSASCAPTRSMLLSGTDNHLAGVGSQAPLTTQKQVGEPGYQERISASVKTIATSLNELGYRTYMGGKWHLGDEPGYMPHTRGFDRSFVLLPGGASHFDELPMLPGLGDAVWLLDDQPTLFSPTFYSTVDITNHMISFIENDNDQDSPFFAYLAYTAPHWPIQAPDDLIEKYEGSYAMGYDELRESRMAGAIREGLLLPGTQSVKNTPGLKPWHQLNPDEQAGYVARMGVYAAMIDSIDQNVGRLLAALETRGELNNTIVVFMSDNGAEGHPVEKNPGLKKWLADNFDNRPENIGRAKSYFTIGTGWARAAAAPFRLTKGRISEGGIRAPAFVHFPDSEIGRIDDAYMTVMDIAPTFMEIAGGPLQAQYRGLSLLPRLRGGQALVHEPDEAISFEVFGRRAVQQGQWKLLLMEPPYGTGEWQLYDLESDPGEQVNVAVEYPDTVERLSTAWQVYADEVGVILPEHPISY